MPGIKIQKRLKTNGKRRGKFGKNIRKKKQKKEINGRYELQSKSARARARSRGVRTNFLSRGAEDLQDVRNYGRLPTSYRRFAIRKKSVVETFCMYPANLK